MRQFKHWERFESFFWKCWEKAAEATVVDLELIKRFHILLAISNGNQIDDEKFDKYSFETANLNAHLYQWYYMPLLVHKTLIHGSQVIRKMVLPIRILFKKAQESRNKDYCQIWQENTCKIARSHTTEDLMHGLLVSSDPVISSIRPLPQKITRILPLPVLNLLRDKSETKHELWAMYLSSEKQDEAIERTSVPLKGDVETMMGNRVRIQIQIVRIWVH